MHLLAKIRGNRSYGNGDINSYINSYMNILEKAKLTASIRHVERFSKSGLPIDTWKSRTRLAEKREEEEEQR